MAVASDLMYFHYRGYSHPPGEVNLVNTEVIALKNERNQTWAKRVVMHVSGEIIYDANYTAPWPVKNKFLNYAKGAPVTDPQDQFSFRILELQDAYSENGYSGGLYTKGGAFTPHYLDMSRDDRVAAATQVDYLSYPKGTPDEFATARSFYIRLSAIFFDEDDNVQAFREHVSIVGDGSASWRWSKAWTPNGQPYHRQEIVNPQSTQMIYQTGSSVGLITYPERQYPPDHLENYEHKDRRVITFGAPRWQGNAFSHYMISWRYVFETPPGTTSTPRVLD